MFVPAKFKIGILQNLRAKSFKKDFADNMRSVNINAIQEEFFDHLLEYCSKGGILDGSNLQELTFPFDRDEYDVFISYSHNDEEDAYYLYKYLTACHLRCFLDSTVWFSTDALLKKIDSQYCMKSSGLYSYEKRNFSTSHVHTMLGMAMLDAIDRSELILFLESDESFPLGTGIDEKTLSPWIYQEMQFANHIRPRIPSRMCNTQTRLFSSTTNQLLTETNVHNPKLMISYNVDFDNFIEFEPQDLDLLFKGGQGLDKVYEKHKIKNYGHRR